MKKSLDRRNFLVRMALAAASGAGLIACTRKEKTSPSSELRAGFKEELRKNRQMPEELVMQMLDQKVDRAMERSHHCAQSSFLALSEQFSLGGEQVLKALTPLPGVAERGETCGAVLGPLMAFGLIYGRGEMQLEDWAIYQESLVPAGKFCQQFEREFGSTMCHEVQKVKFGRCYQLNDPNELREFREAGATDHCSEVVRKAVSLAAKIVLEDPSI